MIDIESQFEHILVRIVRDVVYIKINRLDAQNSIHTPLIEELLNVLNLVEHRPEIKVCILEGSSEYFCTGLDFNAINRKSSDALMDDNPQKYYQLLKLLSMSSKVIISKVEGKVNAGGIGLIAASDIVIASEKATFGLSEALFGLLPACVLPFLIRKIGYQKALWLTLITQGISAHRASQIGLVDELTPNINDTVRLYLLRLSRLETSTISDLKDYMSKLWIINPETQNLAVDKITTLINSEKVQSNITNFVTNGRFPWEK